MTMAYRLRLEPDDNGTILVTSPDLPLVTYGEGEASALANANDAAEALLASMIEAWEDVPRAAARRPDNSTPCLTLSLQTKLKVELYLALRSSGMTRADLGRTLGWQRKSVDRLFRLDHKSKVEQIDAAFHALGKDVGVEVAARQPSRDA